MRDAKLRVMEIHADPDRLRLPANRGGVEELAQSMAVIGLLHPVTVCPEAARWLLVCGTRRLEAARCLGWEMISVRVIPNAPAPLRQLIQAAENLHRSEFSLIEVTDVVLSLQEAGMPVNVMAQALGRQKRWIEALFAIARDPLARALVNAERLLRVEAWEPFLALSPAARKRLLVSDEPITIASCRRAARDSRAASMRSLAARQSPI